ncbi:MAG: hypothetical protein Q8Q23_05190 [bacterium]|nr:hypothetical protein [bacterium]
MNTKKNQKEIFNVILITAVVILVISNIATIFYFYKQKQSKEPIMSVDSSLEVVDKNIKSDNNSLVENEIVDDAQVVENAPVELKKDFTEGEIVVEWNEWLVDASYWQVFQNQLLNDSFEGEKNYQGKELTPIDFFSNFDFYEAGNVKEGIYNGGILYIMVVHPEGPSFRNYLYRIVKINEEVILLSGYSDEVWADVLKKLFIENNNIEISNLETPYIINVPNSDIKLVRSEKEPMTLVSEYSDIEKLFKYDDNNYIYKSEAKDCFIVKAKDGTAREYYFDLEFLEPSEEKTIYSGITPNLIQFTNNNGKKNTEEYIFKSVGSCGIRGCYNYPNYINDSNQLNEIGRTVTDDPIYGLKDTEIKEYNFDEKNILEKMYNMHYTQDKPEYEEFLADYPVIYWQDPFGDFIEFRNAKYLPSVECGKPVIYLYPEEETDVSVWVNPTGGFKVTEPQYNNGWNVKAKPNGELYNYGDDTVYPYLFWEGYGLNYERPAEGFVVARDDVEQFLKEKLIKLGLIQNEVDEFIEFWLPRMQEKLFYFVTFVPQEEFDLIAPLAFSPQPDTVIRVFMDYEGLDVYREVVEQKIITPEREGFVVAEWGGAIHK